MGIKYILLINARTPPTCITVCLLVSSPSLDLTDATKFEVNLLQLVGDCWSRGAMHGGYIRGECFIISLVEMTIESL